MTQVRWLIGIVSILALVNLVAALAFPILLPALIWAAWRASPKAQIALALVAGGVAIEGTWAVMYVVGIEGVSLWIVPAIVGACTAAALTYRRPQHATAA